MRKHMNAITTKDTNTVTAILSTITATITKITTITTAIRGGAQTRAGIMVFGDDGGAATGALRTPSRSHWLACLEIMSLAGVCIYGEGGRSRGSRGDC